MTVSRRLLDAIFPPESTTVMTEEVDGVTVTSMVSMGGMEQLATPRNITLTVAEPGPGPFKPFVRISKIVCKP